MGMFLVKGICMNFYEACLIKPWSYLWLEHKACVCFWWGLVGKQIEMLRARLKPGHKWPWSHSRELGLHWVIGVESSNVSQKQNNKWTWIPRLFSNILLDFAFVSISISKALQGQNQTHALPLLFTPPVAFPILFMGVTICSSQSSWRSWGRLHFLFISYSIINKIAYANDSFCDLAL